MFAFNECLHFWERGVIEPIVVEVLHVLINLGVKDPVAIEVAWRIARIVHIMIHEYWDACFHRVHGVNDMHGAFCLGCMALRIACRIGTSR